MKQKFKQTVSLVLAMIMVFAMSVTAFAAETDGRDTATHTYDVYQIFTGVYSESPNSGVVLSNVKWGLNGTGEEGKEVESSVLTELQGVINKSTDTEKLDVIKKYADLKNEDGSYKTPFQTGKLGQTEFTGLPQGYYLVMDKAGTVSGNASSTLYVVEVVEGTLNITPKSGIPTVSKNILDPDPTNVNEASIGDAVTYVITGTLPANYDSYNTYYYKFTDTLSKGLTVSASTIKVTVDGADVTEYFGVSANEDGDNTEIVVAIRDLKRLANANPSVPTTAGSEIILTYDAILNQDAVIADVGGNPNYVDLTYSNDPNNSGEGTTNPPDTPDNPPDPDPNQPIGQTPKQEVITYTTKLTILKVDEAGAPLKGAEFTLTGNGAKVGFVTGTEYVPDEAGSYWKLKGSDGSISYTTTDPATVSGNAVDWYDGYDPDTKTAPRYKMQAVAAPTFETIGNETYTAFVNDAGEVVFTGLGVGEYTLTESVTPAGYNSIKPIKFNITWTEAGGFAVAIAADSENQDVSINATNNVLRTTIENKSGSLLPSTGGIGTTIFYVIGGILVLGAGILLVTKRRMKAQ